ncbi:hypothetical protein BS47DRAFT_1365264 [Hydnum rufescens UP504]|uniref:Uncharacterized protein n=1 Tax=Hydnum rufescens UP504 TaxID=1448309 RepID=A0A9P6AQ35_9AGAM|nr:hypothetical protein BS47DRAFT_1365264 [Hydnum rufescens UP504]
MPARPKPNIRMPTQCPPTKRAWAKCHPPNKTTHTTPAKAGHRLNQKLLDEHMPNEPPLPNDNLPNEPPPDENLPNEDMPTTHPLQRVCGHRLNEPPLPNSNPPNEQPPNKDLPNQNPLNEGPTQTTHPLRRATI